MTPEVDAVLNRIGWEKVKAASPLIAAQLRAKLHSAATLGTTDTASRKMAEETTRIFKTTIELRNQLEALRPAVRQNINVATICKARAMQMLNEGRWDIPDHVEETRSVLLTLLIGLEATLSRLEHEGGAPRKGNARNLRPHAVANACARIYVAGMGEMPVVSKDQSSDTGVSGLYGRTVAEIFRLLGIRSRVFGPCQRAIADLALLSDGELDALLAIGQGLSMEGIDLNWKNIF